MFAMLEEAAELKKIAFAKLDRGHKGVTVNPNLLIDIILAYESAAVGDTENLNYSLKVKSEQVEKYRLLMGQIADNVHPDSEVWELAMTYV
jgi:hypothetical protein